jgi:molybdenum cofactor cytidylyltransferase
MIDKIAIILLAAGSSSRMGQSKQLLMIDGEPLLLRSSRAALGSGVDRVFVVLGANAEAHQKTIDHLPLTTVVNAGWARGIGHSIKTGLREVLKTDAGTEAVVVLVCDQPRLTQQHLFNLIHQYKKAKPGIVASSYSGTLGVPALFDKSVFNELLSIEDDQGAKKILKNYRAAIPSVNFIGGEIDLDTPADYRNFISEKSNPS